MHIGSRSAMMTALRASFPRKATKILMKPVVIKVLRIFSASVVGKLCHLAVSILAARLLLPEGFGAFAFALGASFLGARIAGLGWPDLAQKLLPKYRSLADWSRFRGVLLSAIFLVMFGGLTVSAGFLILSDVVGLESELRPGLTFSVLLTPLIALRLLSKNLLAAQGKATYGVILDETLPPAFMLMAATASLFNFIGVNLNTFLMSYALGSLLSVVIAFFTVVKGAPGGVFGPVHIGDLRSWSSNATSNLMGNISRLATNRSDVIFLAPLANLSEVGLYAAALRLTYAQTTPSSALSSFYTAKMSESLAKQNYKDLNLIFRYSVFYSGAAAVPFALAFFFFGQAIVDLVYGAEFSSASTILALLGLSQFMAAMVIPMSAVLMMSDNEITYGRVSIAAFLTSAAVNFFLIPIYGALGAAVATLTSTCLLTCLLAAASYRVLRALREKQVDSLTEQTERKSETSRPEPK